MDGDRRSHLTSTDLEEGDELGASDDQGIKRAIRGFYFEFYTWVSLLCSPGWPWPGALGASIVPSRSPAAPRDRRLTPVKSA
jgi:hypothetical protein